jgi:hypothetical protein
MRVLVALWLVGCSNAPTSAPPSPSSPVSGSYEACTSLCLRPGDCTRAYSSDGFCPPGFRCALRYTCAADGGTGD